MATGKSVLIEYVVIKDINETAEMAHILGRLLTGMDVIVNLIPFNPTYVNTPLLLIILGRLLTGMDVIHSIRRTLPVINHSNYNEPYTTLHSAQALVM